MKDHEKEESLKAAIRVIEKMVPAVPCKDPKDDPRWIVLRQLHELHAINLWEADNNVERARDSFQIAKRMYNETKTRLEILEMELKFPEKNDQEEEAV